MSRSGSVKDPRYSVAAVEGDDAGAAEAEIVLQSVFGAFDLRAFGAAAASEGPAVLLLGDVALAHDIGGLLAASRLGLALVIVLLDNRGGGIFDFLPVARAKLARLPDPRGRDGEDIYTRHVATPTGLDFAAAAGLYELAYERARDVQDFRGALERALATDGATLIHVLGERERNAQLHGELWEAVARAL